MPLMARAQSVSVKLAEMLAPRVSGSMARSNVQLVIMVLFWLMECAKGAPQYQIATSALQPDEADSNARSATAIIGTTVGTLTVEDASVAPVADMALIAIDLSEVSVYQQNTNVAPPCSIMIIERSTKKP